MSSGKWALGSLIGADTDDSVIGLTFDDGPDPEETPRILDVLREHDTHATFFMLAERAEQYPRLARRVQEEGHEVALHGATHDDLTRLRVASIIDRVWGGKQRLARVLGSRVTMFRPPYGAQNLRSYLITRLSRLEVVVWSAWAHDWEDLTVSELVDHALRRANPGGILLLHDSFVTHPDRVSAAVPRFDRAQAVTRILEGLAASNLRPTTVSELLTSRKRRRKVWFESDTLP